MLAACGDPYDTLRDIIGLDGPVPGSLKEMGVSYSMVPPNDMGDMDVPAVLGALLPQTRVLHVQRSRGYSDRKSFLPGDMAPLFKAVKAVRPDIFIFVDNYIYVKLSCLLLSSNALMEKQHINYFHIILK